MDQIVDRRRTRRAVAVFLALSAVLTSLVAVAAAATNPAQAAPGDELLASDNPYNWTPKVLDGRVQVVRQIGNTVVVGGQFTQIQNAGSNQPIINQSNLFAFNATTGQIIPGFMPTLNDQVDSLVPGPSGTTVYVAGAFGSVNGVGGRVAELRLSDGTRTDFRAPGINNRVYDLRLVGQRLFIAGSFVTVSGVSEPGMAVLDAATGARLTNYDVPDFGGVAWDSTSTTTVRKIDVSADGSKLVAIGNFNTVGGQSHLQIALFDLGPSTATLANWSTTRFPGFAPGSTTTSNCSRSFDSYMRDVDFAPSGNFFVVVTTGAYRADRLCDTVTRWETNRTGAQVETWSDYTGGDTSWAVEVTGPVVYVGGHMRWFNNPYRADAAGPGAVPRSGMAALDSRNGLPFSWNPGRARGVGLYDFDVTNSQVWAGSDTNKWAGETRPRLAGFPFDSDATPLPPDKVATLPADVVLLDSPAGGVSQEIRNFNGSAILGSASAPAADTWDQARGAVMIDGTVYTGWADGTFRARSYDGSSFGASRTLNLYANGYTTNTTTYTLFGTEIPRITGMFYDRDNARLYYTTRTQGNQSGGFYYRYFTPESGIVGAQRFTAVGGSLIGATGGNSTPLGMFLAGGKVYFSDDAGVLKGIDFTPGVDGAPGGVTGAAVTVNSAADWRSNAMFASTAASSTGPNTSPVAALDVTCKGLDCTVDASNSNDPDGSVVSYAFNFGDGNTTAAGPNATVQHTYETAGTYNVSVTVTDNRGGTDSASQSVSPAPITSSIAFRVSGKYTGANRSTHNWTIPNGVVAGDQMILAVSGSTLQTLTIPAGWTVLDQRLDTDLRTYLLSRVANVSDAGSPVSFVWSGATRTSAVLAAYSGVSGAPAAAGAIESTARTTHTTPVVNVPVDGAWVLSYWADKNAATTDWTAPSGQTVREIAVDPELVGTSTVRVTGLFTDDNKPSASGARTGLTATANASAGKATMFTIVLLPN